MTQRGRAFADIVYTILIVEKTYPVGMVATALGMNYAAFHSRLINRTCFSADEIQNLLEVVPDPRLASYLLERSIFVAAERSSGAAEPVASLQRGATRVVIEATDVLELVDAALPVAEWITASSDWCSRRSRMRRGRSRPFVSA